MFRFYTMLRDPAKQPGHIFFTPTDRRRPCRVHIHAGMGAILAFAAGWAVIHGNDRLAPGARFVASPPRWMAIASLVLPVYYLVLSLVLCSRRAPVAVR